MQSLGIMVREYLKSGSEMFIERDPIVSQLTITIFSSYKTSYSFICISSLLITFGQSHRRTLNAVAA